MVISFHADLDRLREDLEIAGYTVVKISKFPQVPARSVQLRLSNGAMVNWDRQAQNLTLAGPRLQRAKVETCLSALYEGDWFTRSWLRYRRQMRLTTAALALLIGLIMVAMTFSRSEARPIEAANSAASGPIEP